MSERIRRFTLKACAKVEAATDGDILARLVVTFLRRTPRCIIVAKVGALFPIREIGPDGRSSIGLPLLLTNGVCHQPARNKGSKIPMKSERIEVSVWSTYSIIRDFVLGVDHATVRESRSAE